jgi:hypothetical protein
LTNEERAYQEGLIKDQRAYEESQYDKQYQEAISNQRINVVQESIYNEYAKILNSIGSDTKIDNEVVKKQLLGIAANYGQYLTEADMKTLELYINSILSGDVMGTGEANNNIVSQEVSPKKNSSIFPNYGKGYYGGAS